MCVCVCPQVSRRGPPPHRPLNEDQAALKIQSSFRGYKARKEVADMKGVPLVPQRAPRRGAGYAAHGVSVCLACVSSDYQAVQHTR